MRFYEMLHENKFTKKVFKIQEKEWHSESRQNLLLTESTSITATVLCKGPTAVETLWWLKIPLAGIKLFSV